MLFGNPSIRSINAKLEEQTSIINNQSIADESYGNESLITAYVRFCLRWIGCNCIKNYLLGWMQLSYNHR